MLSRRPVSPLQLRAGSWAPAFLDVGVFLAPTPPIRPRGLLQRWGQWECTEVDQQLPRQHPALAQRRNMGPKSGKAIISLYHLPNLVPPPILQMGVLRPPPREYPGILPQPWGLRSRSLALMSFCISAGCTGDVLGGGGQRNE